MTGLGALRAAYWAALDWEEQLTGYQASAEGGRALPVRSTAHRTVLGEPAVTVTVRPGPARRAYASASDSASAGCTSSESTMSSTVRPLVTGHREHADELGGVAADDRPAEHHAGRRVGEDLHEAAGRP